MKRVILLLTIIILLLTGCTTSEKSNPVTESERQKIITFTRQALEIEAKRSELIAFFASFRPPEHDYNLRLWLIDKYFLGGVPAKSLNRTGITVPSSTIEGMSSLRKRLLLLSCPQSTQSIKDALNQIYNSEIELAKLQLSTENLPWMPHFGNGLVLCEVTKDNVGDWKQLAEQYEPWTPIGMQYAKLVQSDWLKAQELRKDTYIRWYEILREHGVDPLEEGLTSSSL